MLNRFRSVTRGKNLNLLILFLLPCFGYTQSRLWQTPAVAQDIQLRADTSAVLAALPIDVPMDGKVFLRFDGNCISSPGDRIVFGASDIPDWRSNDGNTSVNVIDSEHALTCFAHSQVYDITAGTHTYYAVAQNYVDTDGTGIASIDGKLTVVYVPGENQTVLLNGVGIVDGPLEWQSDVYIFKQIEIEAPTTGKILVNLDGTYFMDYEEVALLTSSLSSDWPNHIEMTRVELSADHDNANFTHRKVYDVEAGTYQIYAMAKKIQGSFDHFNDYLYATLSAQFIADETEETEIFSEYVNDNTLSGSDVETLAQIAFDAPAKGQVLLQFAGQCSSSLEDRINIRLRNSDLPDDTLGFIALQPILELNPQTFFSVSGISEVSEGNHAYDVVANFDPISEGSGTAEISGMFTVYFVQDAGSTSVRDVGIQVLDAMIYPNPTAGILFGRLLNHSNLSDATLTLYNSSGKKIREIGHDFQGLFQCDISTLPDGQYLLRIVQDGNETVKTVIKMAAW